MGALLRRLASKGWRAVLFVLKPSGFATWGKWWAQHHGPESTSPGITADHGQRADRAGCGVCRPMTRCQTHH